MYFHYTHFLYKHILCFIFLCHLLWNRCLHHVASDSTCQRGTKINSVVVLVSLVSGATVAGHVPLLQMLTWLSWVCLTCRLGPRPVYSEARKVARCPCYLDKCYMKILSWHKLVNWSFGVELYVHIYEGMQLLLYGEGQALFVVLFANCYRKRHDWTPYVGSIVLTLDLAGGSMRPPPPEFFCDARRTMCRIVPKFCIAYRTFFAQLLVKTFDRVMSGYGVMTLQEVQGQAIFARNSGLWHIRRRYRCFFWLF